MRDGEDLIPSQLLEQAPLQQLRLDPRVHAGRHQDFQLKKSPLRPGILEKSTLKKLTLGLTREWCSDKIDTQRKYLPSLKMLWLNLSTFHPIVCGTSCSNASAASWTCSGTTNPGDPTNCGKRSPMAFLETLDNPELTLLNIKFSISCTGPMFVDVVRSVTKNCRLGEMTDLALAGGGWFSNCPECGIRPPPKINPEHLREALLTLPFVPRLKTLRLSVAPDLLDIMHMDTYRAIALKMPALEKLYLGHAEFYTGAINGRRNYERVSIHHLAAFCSLLPRLEEVSVGTLDGMTLGQRFRKSWICEGIKYVNITHWAGNERSRGVSADFANGRLKEYFPNSGIAREGVDSRLPCFQSG